MNDDFFANFETVLICNAHKERQLATVGNRIQKADFYSLLLKL